MVDFRPAIFKANSPQEFCLNQKIIGAKQRGSPANPVVADNRSESVPRF
jgi:hypothetical protein